MSLAWNTKQLLAQAAGENVPEFTAVEFHLLSWRELYDNKSIITADRYSSGAAEWVVSGDRHFYTVTVTTRPFYELPQELCLFFDCFTETKKFGAGTSIGPPIDQVALEFAALLSVITREPLSLLGTRRVGDRPIAQRYHYAPPPRANRSSPAPPAAVDSVEFASILKGLAGASESTVNAALAAAKLYHAALSLVSFDPSGAYVSLVSAIECLAGHHYEKRKFDFDSVPKFENLKPALHKIVRFPEGSAIVDELKEKLITSEHFLRQKFVLLITEHLPDEFWSAPDELYPGNSVLPPIKDTDLIWCLRRVYDARSTYVHSGEPFPAYIEFGLREKLPHSVLQTSLELIEKDRYLPPFSWFERVAHLVISEYFRRSFAPELVRARELNLVEKERMFAVLKGLPANVSESLKKLTSWTAQSLGYAVINPHAPNKDWADQAQTVTTLLNAGLIGCHGEGLEGSSWLKNREVGEIVGEFFFGSKANPFRGNELLLPKNWNDLLLGDDADPEAPDE